LKNKVKKYMNGNTNAVEVSKLRVGQTAGKPVGEETPATPIL
jgi:hypothetical protein